MEAQSEAPRAHPQRLPAPLPPTEPPSPAPRRYSYPASRSEQAADGSSHGVAGTLELLNARVISTQPLVALDWSADQLGLACAACLDQSVRVLVVSKLEKHI